MLSNHALEAKVFIDAKSRAGRKRYRNWKTFIHNVSLQLENKNHTENNQDLRNGICYNAVGLLIFIFYCDIYMFPMRTGRNLHVLLLLFPKQ